MTREEVILRLRELIDSPTLENQLERVREDEFIIRYYFIYSDTDHLYGGRELPIEKSAFLKENCFLFYFDLHFFLFFNLFFYF